jgi:Tfp pilus assembly protein PilO
MQIKLTIREKYFVIAAAICVVFYFFNQLYLGPKLDEIQKLNGKIFEAQQQLRVMEIKVGFLEKLQKDLKAMQAERAAAVPSVERAIQVLRLIAQNAAKARLELENIRPMGSEGDGVRFEITCAGTYQELYTFLKLLRDLDVVVSIDAFNVSGGGSESPVLASKLLLTAYY